jgi:hypothetical protein
MRNDLVEKYHHYMAEAARLQELVNEQAAYIAELEEALAMNGNEEAAQAKLAAADTDMKDVMAGVKAKNRPFLPKKKPVDLSAEALRLKAEQEIEK